MRMKPSDSTIPKAKPFMNAKAVFLDRDGTLIENHSSGRMPDEMPLLPGAVEGLQLLHQAGYALVVVTDQAGIAHGRFTHDAMTYEEMNLRMRLSMFDIPLHGFYVCPHHSDGSIAGDQTHCLCRKPKPGLLMQAACELNVDLGRSWMVGGILDDVEAGQSAGCRTVLLTNGHETEWHMTPMRWPDLLADNVLEAAHLIMVADTSFSDNLSLPFDAED
jgi:histidinol-phosphate phosphatase family protein